MKRKSIIKRSGHEPTIIDDSKSFDNVMPVNIEVDDESSSVFQDPIQKDLASSNTGAKYWLGLIVFLVVLCLLPSAYVLSQATAPNPEETVAQVALGSELSELDELAVDGYDSLSDVSEWLPSNENLNSDQPTVTNEFGVFYLNDLGSFKDWKASDAERNQFTGEIRLFYFSMVIPDDLNPSFVISYIYMEGHLIKKDWGILPG